MSYLTEYIPPKPTTILDLNDHVLHEVFRNLTRNDLVAVADVCSKFKWNARAVFSLLYKDHRFIIYDIYDRQHSRSILRNFGPAMSSLEVLFLRGKKGKCSQRLMELIAQHCGKSLIEIRLVYITFNSVSISILKPLLKGLRKIDINSCWFGAESDPSEMLSLCTELRSLSITDPQNSFRENFDFQMPLTIPKLKLLDIRCSRSMKNETLERFLEASPQLEGLKLSVCLQKPNRIFESLAQYAPQIKRFKFCLDGPLNLVENAKHFKQLTALKSLSLNLGCDESITSAISEMAAAHVPLEVLTLPGLTGSRELIGAISQLEQLKKLDLFLVIMRPLTSHIAKMVGCLTQLSNLRLISCESDHESTTTDFLEIIRCAPKLQNFEFYPKALSLDLYLQILELVRKREEICRLVIRFGSHNIYRPGIIPEALLEANLNLLKIRD